MRIDVLTIFPDYLAPLELSLIGRARRDGLIDLRVRDLREHTHDRHHTVDDTPYGGGAGMVMKPEPWAEALDSVIASAEPGARPLLLLPGPGGTPFRQPRARELANESHLVFACGRYEGIDERVYDYAAEAFEGRVEVVSLGDYVLNGGEVAALAIIEAVVRLVPGVVGNAESLVEESHEDGLLEYPLYTKPAVWRGRAVPDVLLGGNHQAVAAWRHERRLERTAARRPDLLHRSQGPIALSDGSGGDVTLRPATPADLGELYVLGLACGAVPVACRGAHATATEADVSADTADDAVTWVLRAGSRLVGCVRTRDAGGTWEVSDLLQAPDRADVAVESVLLDHALAQAPTRTRETTLVLTAPSDERLRRLRKAGFRPAPAGFDPQRPDALTLRRTRT